MGWDAATKLSPALQNEYYQWRVEKGGVAMIPVAVYILLTGVTLFLFDWTSGFELFNRISELCTFVSVLLWIGLRAVKRHKMGKFFLIAAFLWHLLYNTMSEHRFAAIGWSVPAENNLVFSDCASALFQAVVYVGVAAATDELSATEFSIICGLGFTAHIVGIATLGTPLTLPQATTVTTALAMICVCSIYMCHLRQRVMLLFFSDMCRERFKNESLNEQLEKALRASQMAERILNHTLKNTMADTAGEIEMFLEAGCSEDVTPLQQCIALLQRGMRCCRHRQAYQLLAVGDYRQNCTVENLAALGSSLAVGRRMDTSFPNIDVYLDPVLCSLVLDNGINNASKHGNPHDPAVTFSIRADDQAGHDQRLRVVFQVTNRADSQKPRITPEFIENLCNGVPMEKASVLSEHVGVQHSMLAAKALGAELELFQEQDVVIFELRLDVKRAAAVTLLQPMTQNTRTRQLSCFPKELTIVCIDDSAPARRLLRHCCEKWLSAGQCYILGDALADYTGFERFVMRVSADIVVCDQNLAFDYLGTDLISGIKAAGFPGLLCIRSGNHSDEDVACYKESGAHCSIPKDMSMCDMAHAIQSQYVMSILDRGPKAQKKPMESDAEGSLPQSVIVDLE